MRRPFQIRIAVASLATFAFLLAFAFAQEKGLDHTSLHGTVRGSRGEPIVGATVRLEPLAAGTQPATTISDSSGHFSFAAINALAYDHVAAEAKGYKAIRIACSLSPGLAKEITITLAPEDNSLTGKPKFDDEPHFTVSGVTDTTALGGHASDTVLHTRDSLAKDTASYASVEKPVPTLTREALEAERDRARALVAKDPGKAESHHMLADADEKLGDSLAAVREYQRAAELDPSEPYLFDWGSELLLHHAPEPALQVFTKGNHRYPKSERMLLGLGAVHFALGSPDEAIEIFREASHLPGHDLSPYVFVGKMEMTKKIPSPAALELLHRFLLDNPDREDANYYYATALWRFREGSHDTALEAKVETMLRKAIHFNHLFAAAYLQLGIIHADQREYEKAISDYQNAIETASDEWEPLVPGDHVAVLAEAHFRLADAYRQSGDRERAETELKTFQQLDQESAQNADRERHEIQQFVYTLRDSTEQK